MGFQVDDHLFRFAHATGQPAWELFNLTGDRMLESRLQGFFTWWSSPRIEVNFLRPLTSLNHWLEYTIFPNTPAAMLFINVVLYAVSVWLAASLYRKLAPDAWIAALAGLMFCVDDGHANSVGWISARNTLLATLFSLAALASHVRAAETGRRSLQSVTALCVILALLAGEAGVWSVGLLTAYAAAFDERPRNARCSALALPLSAAAVWVAIYLYTGPHGVPGSNWYRELSKPLTVVTEGTLDLPMWAAALFGGSVASLGLTLSPSVARLLAFVVAAPALTWLALVVNKTKACRFFALATLLCVLPLMLSVPQERTTIGASFGAFGWIACYVGDAAARMTVWRRLGRTLLVFTHVFLSLAPYRIALAAFHFVENGVQALVKVLPPTRQVVIVNAPFEVLNNYALGIIRMPGYTLPKPESSHVLYAGASDIQVSRPAEAQLDVRAIRGWAYTSIEHPFSATRELPRRGERRQLRGMSATVLESTPDGRPALVRFQFDSPLESQDRGWVRWRGRQPEAWRPPPIGGIETIEGQPLITSLPLGL